MKKRSNVLSYLTYNGGTLLRFELLYKTLAAGLVLPALRGAFNLILSLTRFYYLTPQNLPNVMRHPVTIAGIFFAMLFLACFMLFDALAIIYIIDQSSQREKTDIYETLRFAAKKTARMFLPRNLLLVIFVLILIPFLHFGVAAIIAGTVTLPEFLVADYAGTVYAYAAVGAGLIFLFFVFRRWIYVFHYYALEGENAFAGLRRSAALGRKNAVFDSAVLVFIQAVLLLLYWIAALAGIVISFLVQKALSSAAVYRTLGTSLAVNVLGVLMVMFMMLFLPCAFAGISLCYYRHKEEAGERIFHTERMPDRIRRHAKLKNAGFVLLFAASVAASAFYLDGSGHGRYELHIENGYASAVTAHRGACAEYPENTMAAFLGAAGEGTDWIELDVQLSRDGQVFVMHDQNFRRTTGRNAYAWELDFAEIETLDAGSFFGAEFKGEKIPLLAEAIDFAREYGIRLNIELKPDPRMPGLEEAVAEVVRERNFEKECVIASQDYAALKKIKEIGEEFRTAYVISVAVGQIERLEAADDFSIEASFVSKRLVQRLHRTGHEVYAWTVNSARNMEKMLDAGVDNIITNHVSLAKETVAKERSSDLINRIISRLSVLLEV